MQFPHHNVTLEAAWPGVFVDKHGTYWDVPLSIAVDFASVASGSGLSLLPGLCAKAAVCIKKNIDI